MAAGDDDLALAIEATLRRARAEGDAEHHRLERWRAFYRLNHEAGMSVPDIVRQVRAELQRRGISDEQILGMGVSEASVKQAVRHPPPQ